MSNINIWIRPALDKRQNISRDAEIIQCEQSGMTYTEIAKKFNLSVTRVEQIVHLHAKMLYRRANFKRNELLSNRVIKILLYAGITDTEQVLALSEQELFNLRGVGKMALIEIQNYQKALREDEINDN